MIEPGSGYGLQDTFGLDKTASHEHLPQVRELIESIAPQPGRCYIVNSALGAGEYVGFNLRGDWFTEQGLLHTPPGWDKIPVWDIDARRRAANTLEAVPGYGEIAWGYPTFYNAHRYQHHRNKDPNIARGFMLGAFYDHRMHRVILVSELVEDLCMQHGGIDVYRRIQKGDFPDTSMGAKVPFDECAICGKRARTAADYCTHVNNQDPTYGMGKILPDGRKCGVYNHHPRFFDDSLVFVGAERSAKIMSVLSPAGQKPYSQTVYSIGSGTKVASAEEERIQDAHTLNKIQTVSQAQQAPASTPEGRLMQAIGAPPSGAEMVESDRLRRRLTGLIAFRQAASVDAKLAALDKWGELLKHIPAPTPSQISLVRRHAEGMPELPRDTLDSLGTHDDLPLLLRAMGKMGVVLRPREFQYVMLRRDHPDMARRFFDSGDVFRPAPLSMEESPTFDPMSPVPSGLMDFVRSLLGGGLLGQRSFAPAAVRIRIIKMPTSGSSFSSLRESDDPVLEKISSLYNDYRGGLLACGPEWRYFSPGSSDPGLLDLGMDEKLTKVAEEISRFLPCLAYWPSMSVG